jgi:hypothetical protein
MTVRQDGLDVEFSLRLIQPIPAAKVTEASGGPVSAGSTIGH